jgi:trigger factor
MGIKAELSEIGPCQRLLRVEVPEEAVRAEFLEVYRAFRKVKSVPGFRIGHAPFDLLERYHGKAAGDEVFHRLLRSSLKEALAAYPKLDLVGRPQVTEYHLQPQEPFRYTARLEVAPEVPLGTYRGLVLHRPKIEVNDAQVEEVLSKLQHAHAQLEPVSEKRPAREGDFLVADVVEYRGGKEISKPKELVIHLDLSRDPDGILKGLVGITPGEVRTVSLKAGTELKIQAKVLKEKRLLPLDDGFAKTVGPYPSLESLRQAIRKELSDEAQAAYRQNLIGQIMERLVQEWVFDVPPSLVKSQADRNLKRMALALIRQGVSFEQLNEEIQALQDRAQQDAVRDVKLFFILRRIAAEEGIKASEEELNARIEGLRARLNLSEEEVRRALEERDLLDELEWEIVQTKVLERVLDLATVR